MKEKVLRVILVMLLIMTLTMANVIVAGIGIVSYAIDGISADTSHKNVEFMAYFKNGEEKIASKEESIADEDIRLYMSISVKNEGYFNGEIEVLDSNFKLKEDKLTDRINKIEGNKVILNQINAGETVEIEVAVTPIKDDILDINLLNKETTLKLAGTYKDSTQKDITVNAEKKVNLVIEPEENINVILNSEILTNKVYQINDENKKLVQVLVESGLENNNYPVKSTEIEVAVLENVEDVKVFSRGTISTNGKSGTEFTEANYEYVKEQNKVIIKVQNDEQDGKINWSKSGRDVFVITYILSEDVNVLNEQIDIKGKIELYNSKNTVVNGENTVKIEEEKDGIVNYSIITEESSIYKGKIYSGEDREYKTDTNIYINNSDIVNKVVAREEQSTFVANEKEGLANTQYKETRINKQQMLDILGKDGEIRILDNNSNVIIEINNQTQEDENGEIVVEYQDGITSIVIEISKPEKTGIIEIESTKVIKSAGYKREQIKSITGLKEKISANYNEVQAVSIEKVIELKETSTQATLNINKNSLSTMEENQNVQIEVKLNNNNETQDLFKNPVVRLELPSQIQSVNVNSINLLYEDELTIKSAKLYDGNIIEIELQGEQTAYRSDEVINGATIIINADVTVNKKVASSDEKIRMLYTNENAITYNAGEQGIEEIGISIVAPRELVTINSVDDVIVIGENTIQESKLEISAEGKEVKVGIEVLNNCKSTIENVKIIGNFPTKGAVQLGNEQKENTINTAITKSIEAAGVDLSKVKIYYSEKQNATEDDPSWMQEITNGQTVRSYLILIDNMGAGEGVVANYSVSIPENLSYNEEAIENYSVTYDNIETKTTETISATPIVLTTGKGPEVNVQLESTVGGEQATGDTVVKSGEIIKYTATLTNTGTEVATNVLARGLVPDGTVYITEGEDEYFTEQEDTEEVSRTIESLDVGQSTTFEYSLRVAQNVQNSQLISNQVTAIYSDTSVESNIVSAVAETGDVRVTVQVADEEEKVQIGYYNAYEIKVENLSSEVKENVKVSISENDSIGMVEFDNSNNSECYTIEKMEAGEYEEIVVFIKPNEKTELNNLTVVVDVTTDDKVYKSNEINRNIIKPMVEVKLETENENGYVRPGESIEYNIIVTNTGMVDIDSMYVYDKVSSYLILQEVQKDGESVNCDLEKNEIQLAISLNKSESCVINIKAEVGDYDSNNVKTISNQVNIIMDILDLATSNEVFHIIVPTWMEEDDFDIDDDENQEDDDQDDEEQEDDDQDDDIEDGDNENLENKKMYAISGMAWLDKDKDGEKDDGESFLNNITVKLLDMDTGRIAQYNSQEITAVTNDNGIYSLNNVVNGEYLVIYEYDDTKYGVTEYKKQGISETKNSSAVKKIITVNGVEAMYTTTDIIEVQDDYVSNINIGLVESKIFDLQLNKYINKVVVQNNSGTKQYTYNEASLAKVEIASKQLTNTTVIIEYTIKVTNNGEIDGYVKNIVDYIPSDLKFSSELNKDWYQSGTYLYNKSLANNKIVAGDTEELTLILTKSMTSSNTGLINNTAEIVESYNEYGISDIDSVQSNKDIKEDDIGSADLIISVKTGEVLAYIGLIILVLGVFVIGAYIINKKIYRKEV